MKIDNRLTPVTILLSIFSCLIPFYADLSLPLKSGSVVKWVENVQAIWLLFCCLFTLHYICSTRLSKEARAFWLWAALWWLILFGRSINWGRAYFPEGPRILFRVISVILIGTLILSLLFSKWLRKEIIFRIQNETILVWTFALVVITFFISDGVEHHRYFSGFFLHDYIYRDLVEELYEIPFMVGLFCIVYDLMERQK